MNRHTNYFDSSVRMNNLNYIDVSKFNDSFDALIKGCIDNDIYDQYENYVPKQLIFNDTQEGLLHRIQAYYFSLADLTLFLDVHPNNKNALELYNRYVNDLNETKEIYINNYGPLTLDSINQNSWQWVKTWPWEGSVK
ncbi:MAG: spore coat protein CotJB [Bacilli bacterium]|nr:spore coat protein CotJB [Bacilli bacterium]MDD7315764.1 spore coat protein CotJB [Bacilli bacterium]